MIWVVGVYYVEDAVRPNFDGEPDEYRAFKADSREEAFKEMIDYFGFDPDDHESMPYMIAAPLTGQPVRIKEMRTEVHLELEPA